MDNDTKAYLEALERIRLLEAYIERLEGCIYDMHPYMWGKTSKQLGESIKLINTIAEKVGRRRKEVGNNE